MTVPGELDPKVVSLLELGDGGVQGGKHSKYEKKTILLLLRRESWGKPVIYRQVMQKERTGKESTLVSLETSQVKHVKGRIPTT